MNSIPIGSLGNARDIMNYIDREYQASMKKVILFHHMPLSLVDSKDLKDGMTLPCRQTFTKHIKEYADKTREAIKRLIEVGTNYTVAFDGFQNKSCRRFIGVDLNFFAYKTSLVAIFMIEKINAINSYLTF